MCHFKLPVNFTFDQSLSKLVPMGIHIFWKAGNFKSVFSQCNSFGQYWL